MASRMVRNSVPIALPKALSSDRLLRQESTSLPTHIQCSDPMAALIRTQTANCSRGCAVYIQERSGGVVVKGKEQQRIWYSYSFTMYRTTVY